MQILLNDIRLVARLLMKVAKLAKQIANRAQHEPAQNGGGLHNFNHALVEVESSLQFS